MQGYKTPQTIFPILYSRDGSTVRSNNQTYTYKNRLWLLSDQSVGETSAQPEVPAALV